MSITGWPHETTHECGARAALLVSTYYNADYECRGTPTDPHSAYGPDGCGAIFERTRDNKGDQLMPYDYETERVNVTSEMLLRLAFGARRMLRVSGVATMEKLMGVLGAGSAWTQIAAVEQLVELGYLQELATSGLPTQYRVFRAGELLLD